MKTIKQAVIIILALLVLANIVTYFYLGTSDRKVGPQITCPDEPLEISAKDNESALLVDVTAKDEQDGDLTNRISIGGISKLISKDTAKVTYMVFDSDNNMASCVRYIRYVDYHRPTFEVLAKHNVTWSRRDSYCENQFAKVQPEEFPTMPVSVSMTQTAPSDYGHSFDRFNFDREVQ